jgi:hypothetical protein
MSGGYSIAGYNRIQSSSGENFVADQSSRRSFIDKEEKKMSE